MLNLILRVQRQLSLRSCRVSRNFFFNSSIISFDAYRMVETQKMCFKAPHALTGGLCYAAVIRPALAAVVRSSAEIYVMSS